MGFMECIVVKLNHSHHKDGVDSLPTLILRALDGDSTFFDGFGDMQAPTLVTEIMLTW